MRSLLIVCFAGALLAQPFQSPSPPRDRAEQKKTANNKEGSTQERPGPTAVPSAPGPSRVDQPPAGDEKGPANEKTNQIWKKAFAPEMWSNWALVIVGALATYAAIRTLKAIKEQDRVARIGLRAARIAASAATVSAKAAKKSADAFMNGARGWILVEKISAPRITDSPAYFEYGSGLQPAVPYFVFCLRVFGNTPCRILSAGMRFHLVPMKEHDLPPEPDLPESPAYWGTIYGLNITGKTVDIPESGRVLAPRERLKMGAVLESGSLSTTDLSFIEGHENFACAYGFVNYADTFGEPHETRFCYIYRVSHRVIRSWETGEEVEPSSFRVGGPLAYNREE